MKSIPDLFDSNRAWAKRRTAEQPDFFDKLSAQQTPKYLWIGCADSRVPATEICGLQPGEMFVHRNVANLVVHTDLNCLSVLQYAVDVLKVTDVIVCGHYGCGGVETALDNGNDGLIDNWLAHIKDIYTRHRQEVDALSQSAKVDRMCELSVIAQVKNTCYTSVVRQAWARGESLAVHGWIYRLGDGLLHDLGASVRSLDDLPDIYRLP